jgi:O-antigen/teichoic acid export membrane protein
MSATKHSNESSAPTGNEAGTRATGSGPSQEATVAPRRTPRTSALKNVLSNWGALAVTLAVTFVQSPFIVRNLGNTYYGLWVLVGSLVGYLGLLDFGVRSAVTRYIARLHAEHADDDASTLISTAIRIFAVLGLTVLVGSIVIAGFIIPRFHFQPDELKLARIVVLISGATLAGSMVNGAFGGVVVGLQRFDISATIDVVIALVRAMAVYVALKAGFGVAALALIQLIAALARTGVTYVVAARLYPELNMRSSWHREWARQVLSFSILSTLINFSGTLVLYSDSLVIGAFLPAAQITMFAIASTLTDYTRSITRGVSMTMIPRIGAMEGGHDLSVISALILQASRLTTLMILPVGITFLIRGPEFIGLWMGRGFAVPSGAVLQILTIALLFQPTAHVMGASLVGLSHQRSVVPLVLAEAAVNMILSIVLIRPFGIAGVAWGTTLPSLVLSLIVFPLLSRKLLGIRVWSYNLETRIRPLLAMVPFAIGTLLIKRFAPVHGLITYFASVAAALPLAAVGAWFVGLDPAERARVVMKGRAALAARRASVDSHPTDS